jgi:transposase
MLPQISQSAAMRRDDICLYVSPSNRARLEALIADRNTPSKVVWRAEIVLATADGHGTNEIMRRTGKSKPCVWRWQERYLAEGVEGLLRDKTRPSRRPPLTDAVKLAVLTKTAHATPAHATHWSRATMAAAIGISPSSVGRIWAAAGLKPHRVAKFKLSNDPQFAEKVTDVVGLYLNPPDRALVLCVDEKSQIQALDRTQPGLPPRRASRARQLRGAQDRRGEGVARQASPLPAALHADQRVLAQSRRTVLCRDHDEAHPARCLRERGRVGGRDPRLSRSP